MQNERRIQSGGQEVAAYESINGYLARKTEFGA